MSSLKDWLRVGRGTPIYTLTFDYETKLYEIQSGAINNNKGGIIMWKYTNLNTKLRTRLKLPLYFIERVLERERTEEDFEYEFDDVIMLREIREVEPIINRSYLSTTSTYFSLDLDTLKEFFKNLLAIRVEEEKKKLKQGIELIRTLEETQRLIRAGKWSHILTPSSTTSPKKETVDGPSEVTTEMTS
jgi:hypothetical protein